MQYDKTLRKIKKLSSNVYYAVASYQMFPGAIMELSQADRQHLDKSKQDTGSLGNTNDGLKYDSGRIAHDFSCIHSKDLLPAVGGEEATKHFLQELVNILLAYISKSLKRSSKVLDFHYPHQLKEGLEGFSLELPDQPDNLEQLLVDCRDTLKYGVKTGHIRIHYSIKKSASVLGIGSENVIVVRCDKRAHSVTWNPHKMMGVPLQCSTILVKRKGLLQECNQLCAEYLFQPDKHYDVSYDTGDKTIQCGRHVDVFKLWLMWKAKGSEGFEAQINHCLENAEYLYYKLKRRTDFQLVFKGKPEHSNVCFWYLPKRLQNISPGPERDRELHMVAPQIKTKMMEEGFTMIGYQPLEDKVNFFRCVFSNPATQREDVDFLIDEIARLGCEL
ncbi:glutamate decarboxylase 1-like protein [Labeo rohita]|uniref:Glutamate decarboxylase 1-like protein n=1 Tax=Labeo rohita TaxID=84645 RepID=A0A498LBZ0_LABRO|nr:glutamate decarboxylase 1-like protein [Labeo rohita]